MLWAAATSVYRSAPLGDRGYQMTGGTRLKQLHGQSVPSAWSDAGQPVGDQAGEVFARQSVDDPSRAHRPPQRIGFGQNEPSRIVRFESRHAPRFAGERLVTGRPLPCGRWRAAAASR
jgi:hypothetical protein